MFLDNLSASILRLCNENHLTYESASERCDISSRYFGDIARRKTSPIINTLEKICIGFERTPNDLLLLSDVQQELSFRIPMPVAQIHYFHTFGELVGYPICPKCKTPIEREYQHFCDRCGQLLDWTSYDKATVILKTK